MNYNPAAGQVPSLLNQETVQLLFTVQPIRQLTIDNTYLLDRDHAVSNGAFVYEAQTMRSKVNYQFTRSISARVIAEYDSTLANPAETSLLRTKAVCLAGASHLAAASRHRSLYRLQQRSAESRPQPLQSPARRRCDPNNTTPPRAGPLLNDGRQIFIKASYLFRF